MQVDRLRSAGRRKDAADCVGSRACLLAARGARGKPRGKPRHVVQPCGCTYAPMLNRSLYAVFPCSAAVFFRQLLYLHGLCGPCQFLLLYVKRIVSNWLLSKCRRTAVPLYDRDRLAHFNIYIRDYDALIE